MISNKSAHAFIYINGALLMLGLFQYYCMLLFYTAHVLGLGVCFIVCLQKNYVLLYAVNNATKYKPTIHDSNPLPSVINNTLHLHLNVISSAAIECLTHICMVTTYYASTYSQSMVVKDIVYFIPMSFAFELVFDFFHYTTHRLLHHPCVYKYFHKKHHTYTSLIPIMAFYQDPVDILVTNSLPMLATMYLFQLHPWTAISYVQLHWILVYKTYIEICGHSGTKSYPTSSFPQFIWLPKWLSIELYTEIHDLHHSANNCNYSKRFSIWDKAFGTFKHM